MSKKNNSSGYEKRDIVAGPIVLFLVAVAVLCLLALWGMRIMMTGMEDKANLAGRGYEYQGEPFSDTPSPLLEVHPSRGYEELAAEEFKLLTSYSWVDQANGIVRIPIEKSLLYFEKHPLPSRKLKAEEQRAS